MSDFTIGIDLGGTKIEAALIDSNGKDHADLREKTKAGDDPDEVVHQILTMADKLVSKSGNNNPLGAGIGVAGQIEAETGMVRGAPNLGWKNYPLKEKLSDELDIPLLVNNDVRLAAYGEWKVGAGRGVDNMICIFVGTGVGGGIVSDGKLLSGQANTAGEIGHMTVDLDGPSCRCPNHGCIEAYAGGWAIERRAKEIIEDNPKERSAIMEFAGGNIEQITAESVGKAALGDDSLAKEILREAGNAMVAGCVSLVNALSPSRLILGGGVIEGYTELVDIIEKGVRERALPAAIEKVEVVKAALGSDAGVIGAALAVREMIKGKENKDE